MAVIAQKSAYQGQGLGIAMAGPVILAPLGAMVGGAIRLILFNIPRRD
ncbi:MAG: hypothetical protein ACFCU8_14190 [Thermosynechococcaceae cyanobacterium]